jgi:transcriptional regulator with XRE-family HTH domain
MEDYSAADAIVGESFMSSFVTAPTAAELRAQRETRARDLGKRAKSRRASLGMSILELTELIGGIRVVDTSGWESRFPIKHIAAEARWELALQVPAGWLRDTSIPTPALAGGQGVKARRRSTSSTGQACSASVPKTVDLSQVTIDKASVAHEIVTLCLRSPNMNGLPLDQLTWVKRSTLMLMVCRAGIFGRHFSSPAVAATQFKRTVAYIANLERGLRDDLRASREPAETRSIDTLVEFAQQYLPCTVTGLDALLRSRLGGELSVVDLNRFARYVLGRNLFKIVTIGSDEMVLPAAIAEQDLSDVRDACVATIRSTGATTISLAMQQLGQMGRKDLDVKTVSGWCEALGGFEWIDRESGWFWLGPAITSRVGTAVLKVLAASACIVDIEDLRRGVKRIVASALGDDVELPPAVLSHMVCRYDGISGIGARFTLTTPLGPESILTPNEMHICQALSALGDEATMGELTARLVEPGVMSYATMACVLVDSPTIVRLGRNSYGIRGRKTDREGGGRPLGKERARAMGVRAAARREALGLTLLQVAERTGVMTPTRVAMFEQRLPALRAPAEQRLEAALEVPAGWLREPDIGHAAARPASTADAEHAPAAVRAFTRGTVARNFADLFYSTIRDEHERGVSRAGLRNVEMMAWEYGLHGAVGAEQQTQFSRKSDIAKRFGISVQIIKSVEMDMAQELQRTRPATPALDQLVEKSRRHLPMSAKAFDGKFRRLLGAALSISDLARACRSMLGRAIFETKIIDGVEFVLSPGDGEKVMQSLRKIVVAMVRATGGAHLACVCGALMRAVGRPVDLDETRRRCQLLEGFSWLDERTGWFWLRLESEPPTSVRQTLLKVLAIAPGAVALRDLMGAISKLRTHYRESELPPNGVGNGFVAMPVEVLATLVARFPEVQEVQAGSLFRLRTPIQPEDVLNPSELRAYRIVALHGGVIAAATIGDELAAEGGTTAVEVVVRCVIVTSVERGVYRLFGFPLEAGAYARACNARLHDVLGFAVVELEEA